MIVKYNIYGDVFCKITSIPLLESNVHDGSIYTNIPIEIKQQNETIVTTTIAFDQYAIDLHQKSKISNYGIATYTIRQTKNENEDKTRDFQSLKLFDYKPILTTTLIDYRTIIANAKITTAPKLLNSLILFRITSNEINMSCFAKDNKFLDLYVGQEVIIIGELLLSMNEYNNVSTCITCKDVIIHNTLISINSRKNIEEIDLDI